jgi:hypothetical protein
MEQVVPLNIAAEHYADGMRRGFNSGKESEYLRILELLKKNGYYESVVLIMNTAQPKKR